MNCFQGEILMFCPKCGEEISVREKEDAEKIARLRELLMWIKGTGTFKVVSSVEHIDYVLRECK